MTLHYIRTIAVYEMKTLLRSWFFRIFSGLMIAGLAIFNIAVFAKDSDAPFIFRALGASIPYANLIILNLGQAIVAVFLASEFLKQDRKNDTVEVIYARPMGNGTYIAGKTLGILLVFAVLNLIVLLLSVGFSFIAGDAAHNILAYFSYPFLISLPTLLFVLGLSYFCMVTIKNQAVTFILLLGYLALTIFYLNKKLYHLFDFIAYQVPMMHSSFTGFGNLLETLMHRGMFLLLGIGLIFFTVYRLPRLPGKGKKRTGSLVLTLVFLILGSGLMYRYILVKQGNDHFVSGMEEVSSSFQHLPVASLAECDLNVVHHGAQLDISALIALKNSTAQSIDTLVLRLNPGLSVIAITQQEQSVSFFRREHLLLIPLEKSVLPGEKRSFSISYTGQIDERVCYPDKQLADEDNFSLAVYTLRKRYAFLTSDYVCLTANSLWYPLPGTGYTRENPFGMINGYTRFSLQVTTTPGLTVVSQGAVSKNKEGEFSFRTEQPLSALSLVIGLYEKKSILVDSVEYAIYTKKGNDYYSEYFSELGDSVGDLIAEVKKEYSLKNGFSYPFKRFAFVEVPVQFSPDKHQWSLYSDAVQPEMILYPEKGVLFKSSDFRKRKYWIERDMKRNQEEVMPKELQSRLFKQFLRDNFLAGINDRHPFDRVVDFDTYSLFPEYYSFSTGLRSNRWPVLNMAFESYLKERNQQENTTNRWFRDGISKNEKINMLLKERSLADVLKEGIQNEPGEENPVRVSDVIQSKGRFLFNILKAKLDPESFDNVLMGFISQQKFTDFNYNKLDSVFVSAYQTSTINDVEKWYSSINLPGFLIKDINTYKLVSDEKTQYQVIFDVANPTTSDGVVTFNIELTDKNRDGGGWWNDQIKADYTRQVYLPAGSARKTGFVFTTEPARMGVFFHVAENLPGYLAVDFKGFDEVRKAKPIDTVYNTTVFSSLSEQNEIIVDNEDDGFNLQQVSNKGYLKQIIDAHQQQEDRYEPIRFWNPPGEWLPVLRSEFYGKFVHSARYTAAGEGDRKAMWKTAINDPGNYDVYFYVDRINVGWRRRKQNPDFYMLINHAGGSESVHRTDDELENGWNYIGTFYCADSASVELTNRSIGDMVVADAVKWVKNN